MSDEETGRDAGEPAAVADATMGDDVRALRRQAGRDLPAPVALQSAVEAALSGRTARGGTQMTMRSGARRGPLRALAVVAVVAAMVITVPFPYTRVTGHAVRVELDGVVPEATVRAAARALRGPLGVTRLRVRVEEGAPGAARTVLEGEAPLRSRPQLDRLLGTWAEGLRSRGVTVHTQVTARTERAHGSVYAMARDKAPELRIDTSQSVEALRESLVRQLDEAGVEGAAVDVEREGDETRVHIRADAEAEGLVTRKEVRMHLRGAGEGRANLGGPPVPRQPGMSDEQYREAVRAHLRDEGFPDAEVTVEGGRVEVRVRREPTE